MPCLRPITFNRQDTLDMKESINHIVTWTMSLQSN
jgi:hypothetical protein